MFCGAGKLFSAGADIAEFASEAAPDALRALVARIDGKEKLVSFGSYPEVGLADARLRRIEAKLKLRIRMPRRRPRRR